MTDLVICEYQELKNIADATRSVSGNTEPMTLNGMAYAISNLSASSSSNMEVWTFTLEDGTIVEKEVCVGETIVTPPPAPSYMTFWIDSRELHADPGMTWDEWVNSDYNTIDAYKLGGILGSGSIEAPRDGILGTGMVCYEDYANVFSDDAIIEGYVYIVY